MWQVRRETDMGAYQVPMGASLQRASAPGADWRSTELKGCNEGDPQKVWLVLQCLQCKDVTGPKRGTRSYRRDCSWIRVCWEPGCSLSASVDPTAVQILFCRTTGSSTEPYAFNRQYCTRLSLPSKGSMYLQKAKHGSNEQYWKSLQPWEALLWLGLLC